MFKSFVGSRWMPLVDVLCAVASGIFWIAVPALTWPPLLVGLLPIVIRLALGQYIFKPDFIDISILVFLLTTIIGIWASYHRELALGKFWLVFASILVFYAFAAQPKENYWAIAALLGLCSFIIAAVFLLAHNWRETPSRFALINFVGRQWMRIRPALISGEFDLDPDVVGGLIALLLPFAATTLFRLWHGRHWVATWITAILFCLSAFGLLLTAQRGAWLALGVVLSTWVLWVTAGYIADQLGRQRWIVMGVGVGVSALMAILIGLAYPDAVLGVLSPENRLEVARNTVALIRDFAFTGGGLAAYPALYSRYILHIPSLFIQHSSNLFLDIAIEQGVLGLLALLAVILRCLWLLSMIRQPNDISGTEHNLMRWMTLGSLIVLIVYGLFEDPFYSGWGALFLFIPIGMTAALSQFNAISNAEEHPVNRLRNVAVLWRTGVGIATLTAAIVLTIGITPALRSAWHANLGALEMARVELQGYPDTPRYWVGLNTADLEQAETLLVQSNAEDPVNQTANYRLGLIAALRLDYRLAIVYLESAYRVDPQHRGTQKILGYSYAWSGQLDEAAHFLSLIPEAKHELQAYYWWWSARGQDQFASNSTQMVQLLEGR